MDAVFADSEHRSIRKPILAKIQIVGARVDSDCCKRVFASAVEPFQRRRVGPLLTIVRIFIRRLF